MLLPGVKFAMIFLDNNLVEDIRRLNSSDSLTQLFAMSIFSRKTNSRNYPQRNLLQCIYDSKKHKYAKCPPLKNA